MIPASPNMQNVKKTGVARAFVVRVCEGGTGIRISPLSICPIVLIF